MDNKKNKILEALQLQPLSDEEKKSRHILGRLYGPIATCTESTRNGRKYNKDLWEKALADDIFKEKIGHKSLFLELGHPVDREETDMEKVCACIPEIPKIIDGDLYAYVDILDTNNGRLLKTLCDYGFVPGISSRGSGDVMPNDEVDPNTFFLETWDIVQLPAVKKARLAVCESFDAANSNGSLKQALCESYAKADAKEKAEMREALNNLELNILDEAKDEEEIKVEVEEEPVVDEIPVEDAPAEEPAAEEAPEVTEDGKVDLQTAGDVIDLLSDYDKDASLDIAPIVVDGEEHEISNIDINPTEDGNIVLTVDVEETPIEEVPVEEEPVEEVPVEEEPAEVEVEVEEEPKKESLMEADDEKAEDEPKADDDILAKVINAIDLLKDKLDVEIKDNKIVLAAKGDLKVEDADKVKVDVTDEETEVIADAAEVIEDDKAEKAESDDEVDLEEDPSDVNIEVLDDEAVEVADETEAEPEKSEEAPKAVDDGLDDEILEGIKDLVRKNGLLEQEVKSLRTERTVGDAKVKDLQEELDRYKRAFGRTSELAADATKAKKEVKALQEQLSSQAALVEELREKEATRQTLTENAATSKRKIEALSKELIQARTDNDTLIESYEAKITESRQETNKYREVAQRYKSRFESVLESYIGIKAKMLGVKSSEITERLGKAYSVEDIDRVCESLLSVNVNISRLPFNTVRGGMRIKESVETKPAAPMSVDDGYEIDDSLLELAGLKD